MQQAEHSAIEEKKILVSDMVDNYSLVKQNNVGEKAIFEVAPMYNCAFGLYLLIQFCM